jgi:hypothetical protein
MVWISVTDSTTIMIPVAREEYGTKIYGEPGFLAGV